MDGKKIVAGLVAVAAGILYLTHAHAAAAAVKAQAPGFYRMALGDFEIITLSDGTLPLTTKQLVTDITSRRAPDRSGAEAWQSHHQPESGRV